MSFLARITGRITGQVVQAYRIRDVHLHQRAEVEPYDDGWPSAEERLKGYVKAADHLVRDRPCLGLPAGVAPPPFLSAVHLQRVRREDESVTSLHEDGFAHTIADKILDRGRDCLVVGLAGTGKTALLLSLSEEVARRWRRGDHRWLPVYVLASDLVPSGRTVPQALAVAANAELRKVAGHGWRTTFFAEPPAPGGKWLVLVDGLDEVLSPAHRAVVLRTLAGQRDKPYCFVVASRPLPESDLATSWRHARYRLLALDEERFSEFAMAWFTTLRVHDPEKTAADFRRVVERSGLNRLARVPLMTSMLCQLYAANPGTALPASRNQIYDQFTRLLFDRMKGDRDNRIDYQLREALSELDARDSARALLAGVRGFTAKLAFCQEERVNHKLIDLLDDWTGTHRPPDVDERAWQRVLLETMCRTGMFYERRGDLSFTHSTVAEFLAAKHVLADPLLDRRIRRSLFSRWRPRNPLLTTPFGHERNPWSSPVDHESFVRFLVGGWTARPDVKKVLERLASQRGRTALDNCRMIATMHTDGVELGQQVTHAAITTLLRLATSDSLPSSHRLAAVRELARFDDPRVPEVLDSLAADASFSPAGRVAAAGGLARADLVRGAVALARLTTDPAVTGHHRLAAAVHMSRIEAPGSVELLAHLAEDGTQQPDDRVIAATELARHDPDRGACALQRLADHLHDTPVNRLNAAMSLARLRMPGGDQLLVQMASDPRNDFGVRLFAAIGLADVDVPLGASALWALAADTSLPDTQRALTCLEFNAIGR